MDEPAHGCTGKPNENAHSFFPGSIGLPRLGEVAPTFWAENITNLKSKALSHVLKMLRVRGLPATAL